MTFKNASIAAIASAVALVGAGVPAAAQETPYATINAAAASADIVTQPLRGAVVLLQGSGGNMVAMPGPQGLLMIDDGIALSEQKLRAALQQIEAGAIKYAVNTHWHWDHSDGNVWVHDAGATIIAQARTARHLGETIRVVEWGHTFTPLPAGGRAAMLVEREKTLDYGDERVRLRYYGPSHTDGDLSAYFEKADILVTGDTWWNGLYPFIDYVAGGSIDGMIQAANANIEMTGENTIVVPGHGPIGSRADLIEYRDMLVTIRATVASLKKRGLSLPEVQAAKPTAAFDAKWGQAIISPDLFTQLVYRGV